MIRIQFLVTWVLNILSLTRTCSGLPLRSYFIKFRMKRIRMTAAHFITSYTVARLRKKTSPQPILRNLCSEMHSQYLSMDKVGVSAEVILKGYQMEFRE